MKDGDRFISDLKASRVAVNRFAALGFKCFLPPERTRPTEGERFAYADDGMVDADEFQAALAALRAERGR